MKTNRIFSKLYIRHQIIKKLFLLSFLKMKNVFIFLSATTASNKTDTTPTKQHYLFYNLIVVLYCVLDRCEQ